MNGEKVKGEKWRVKGEGWKVKSEKWKSEKIKKCKGETPEIK